MRNRPLREQAKRYAALGPVPFLIGFVSPWLSWILEVFLFLVLLPALCIIGVAYPIKRMIEGCRRGAPGASAWQRLPATLFPLAMLALCIALFLPGFRAGSSLGETIRFALHRPKYEAIIAAARRGQLPYRGDIDGVHYDIDPGPPIRIAFDGEGLLDNWSGVVYDPTGVVMQARGYDPVSGTFIAPQHVTDLFGGDLVECTQMSGDYYSCGFT